MDLNKNYNTLCNNFYGNLSKLGKIMSKNLESENIDNFNLYDYDKTLFYNVIFLIKYRSSLKIYIEEAISIQLTLL